MRRFQFVAFFAAFAPAPGAVPATVMCGDTVLNAPTAIQTGDLNGDGQPDVVTVSGCSENAGSIDYYLNPGSMQRLTAVQPESAREGEAAPPPSPPGDSPPSNPPAEAPPSSDSKDPLPSPDAQSNGGGGSLDSSTLTNLLVLFALVVARAQKRPGASHANDHLHHTSRQHCARKRVRSHPCVEKPVRRT